MNRLLRRPAPHQTFKNAPIFVSTPSTIVLYPRKSLKPYRANSGRLRFSFIRNCSSESIHHRLLVAKGEGQGPLWSRPAEPHPDRVSTSCLQWAKSSAPDGPTAWRRARSWTSCRRLLLALERSCGGIARVATPAPRSLYCILHYIPAPFVLQMHCVATTEGGSGRPDPRYVHAGPHSGRLAATRKPGRPRPTSCRSSPAWPPAPDRSLSGSTSCSGRFCLVGSSGVAAHQCA